MTNGRAYYVVTPIGASGIGLLGDRGQFVTLGKKRIVSFVDDGAAHVTVAFAAGETSRTIFGYAPSAPAASAATGGVGPVAYDPATARFSVEVTPGQDQTAAVDLSGVAADPAERWRFGLAAPDATGGPKRSVSRHATR